MRVATLVIGLVLMLGVFIQSLAAAAGGSLLEDKEMQDAAALGILVALGYVIGSATVLALPRFAMWTFVATGVIGICAGATPRRPAICLIARGCRNVEGAAGDA